MLYSHSWTPAPTHLHGRVRLVDVRVRSKVSGRVGCAAWPAAGAARVMDVRVRTALPDAAERACKRGGMLTLTLAPGPALPRRPPTGVPCAALAHHRTHGIAGTARRAAGAQPTLGAAGRRAGAGAAPALAGLPRTLGHVAHFIL